VRVRIEDRSLSLRIGIDVGGTKIEGIALDDDRVLSRRRIPTPRASYDGTVRAVAELTAALQAEIGERGSVGIGIPGAISAQTGLVKNANSVWLIGHPFDRDIESALGQPVRVSNDANCFALSEAIDGAGKGAACVFGVIIGTGTGGGLVINRQVREGRHRIAGEWGHNPLPWPSDEERPGRECYCGLYGCIETFLSGPGLSHTYESFGGVDVTADVVAERAAAGEVPATAALDLYESRMARALATIINVIDPDVIVLGGGLSNIDRLYAAVPVLWKPYVFSDRADTPLVRASHGDSSGVRGAAWLW
jgi:fructokinase